MKGLKKALVLTASFSAVALLALYNSPTTEGKDIGAPAGKTGSPGDASNCTGCHAGTATTVAGLITSNIPVTGYVPGTTYTITATIASPSKIEFGFEISPQNTAGTKKGTMVVTDPTNTQLVTGTSGKYITHKAAGTAGTGSRTWTFDWIAPVAGSGNFNFYGAFVISNSSNTNAGDIVRLSSLAVVENVSTGVEENVVTASDINVYPNPVADQMSIVCDKLSGKADISIFDITGKLVKTVREHELSENQTIDIADMPRGIYVLKISTEKGEVVKKIVKQ